MIKLSERSRMLASQALLQRAMLVEDDAIRYRKASYTASPQFNAVNQQHAARLEKELKELHAAVEELRTC